MGIIHGNDYFYIPGPPSVRGVKAKTLDSLILQMLMEHLLQGRPCTVPGLMGIQPRTKETKPQTSGKLSSSGRTQRIDKKYTVN